MIRRPPSLNRTVTRFSYPTLFRSELERFGDEGRLALAVAARLDVQVAGLLQFLPVPDIDSHGFPFALGGTDGGRPSVQRGFYTGRSEERRVGKECVSTCSSRWSPYH